MTSKSAGWRLSWYEASALVGSGAMVLPLQVLETALRGARVEETRTVTVQAGNSTEARVTIVTRARHSGAACERLLDLLAHSAPRGWDWESASVRAHVVEEGIRHWPRLSAVPAGNDQQKAEHVARVLAGWVFDSPDGDPTPEERAIGLDLLEMTGLTFSAGSKADPDAPGLLSSVEP